MAGRTVTVHLLLTTHYSLLTTYYLLPTAKADATCVVKAESAAAEGLGGPFDVIVEDFAYLR